MPTLRQLVRLVIARIREAQTARAQAAYERRVVARILLALAEVEA